MNRVGLLIDVSHVAKPGMMQAAALSLASHSHSARRCSHY
jgi:microsomal dipeptidase-like Zn-dependent dipeptidase